MDVTAKKKQLTKSKLNKENRKELFKELLPLIKSFALWMVLVIIVASDYTSNRWFSMAFINYTTYLSFWLAKIMFIPAQITGAGMSMVTTLEVNFKSIIIDHYPMIVELECSAYHAYLAMISLVTFSSWKWKQKLVIGSFIFAALSIINSLRIVILGVIGHESPKLFNMMHDYIWNILLVIIIWGLWEFANQKLKNKGNAEIPEK